MIQDTLQRFIESRSVLDLLLVYFSYSFGWFIYIYSGIFVSKIKMPFYKHVESSLFMGAFCLFTKPYLPITLFSFLSVSTLTYVFYRASGLSWLRSVLTVIAIDFLAALGDFVILKPLLKMVPIYELIVFTSPGILIGTIAESIFPLFILSGVKLCQTNKRLNWRYFYRYKKK